MQVGEAVIRITDKTKCCGCMACQNICPNNCILMAVDSEGFWYPQVDLDKCTDCGLCEKACPILNPESINNQPVAYAAINKSEESRISSSSGGIFTLLAQSVLENNGVVFGACFDEQFNVVHRHITSKDDIHKFKGSKYLQSNINSTYQQAKMFLDQGRSVLFTGTPCQTAGLRAYLGKGYENLFTHDIVCHGVPSPKVWRRYLDHMQRRFAKVKAVRFRAKETGWKSYSLNISFADNSSYCQTVNKDIYMRAFLKDVCLRPSCYDCRFKGLNRSSDITLADFWGIQNVLPELDDDKGTSLIWVNSPKGQALLEGIKTQVVSRQVDINQAIKYNSAAIRSAKHNPKRQGFLRELDILPFDRLVKKYCTDSVAVRIKRRLKTIAYVVLKKLNLINFSKHILRKK